MRIGDDVLTPLAGAVLAISANLLGWLGENGGEIGHSIVLGGFAAIGGHLTKKAIEHYSNRKKKKQQR